MGSDISKIANAWLTAQQNLWAHHELLRLCEEDPNRAWAVIEAMIECTADLETLKLLGVGPVEDLVSERGADIIDNIERSAKVQPRVIVCLSAVAKSTTEEAVWARIQRLVREGHAV